MSRTFTWIGRISLALISVFILVVLVWTLTVGIHLDSSSKAWVDSEVNVMMNLAQPGTRVDVTTGFLNSLTPASIESLQKHLTTFGKPKQYLGSEGQAIVHVSYSGMPVVTAEYTAQAEFEKGIAKIRIVLMRIHGNWYFQTINISK